MTKKLYKQVGTVSEIYRYPVKSMAGEKTNSAWIGWHGLDGDRRYAFIKKGSTRGFPWLTIRDVPRLLVFKPYHTDLESIRNSQVRVITPDGRDMAINDPELQQCISHMSRHEPQLIHLWSGIYDAMDLSMLTTRSVASIQSNFEIPLDMRRFRTNIVIDIDIDVKREFPEDKWLKNLLVFGETDNAARVRVNRKDPRCMAVNLDPDTAEQDGSILKQIVYSRKNLLGVYGSTERPGTVNVGDKVFITE